MRFAVRLAGVLLLAVGLAGCDKAQIAQLESQLATVTITVVGTDAELFNVWDFTEITDLDGTPGPDDPTIYLYCESVPVPLGLPPRVIPVQAPWQHSVRVSVLRADSTEFEQVTDPMYESVSANLTPYDDQVLFGNAVQKPDLTIMDGAILRTFRWSNGRQMSTVNRNVIVATNNPLSTFDPVTYGFRNGLCSLSTDPGPSSLAGAPQPFTFELGKGDTIKVEARKALVSPPGLIDDSTPLPQPLTLVEPVIVGRLAIDGINITNLGGDASSAPVVGDGFSFFYSSR